jgi:hypothetical protein
MSAESVSSFTRSELLLLDQAAQNYVAHLRKRHGRHQRSAEAVRALAALEATAASAAQKARDLATSMEATR